MTTAHREEQLRIQALGAALSRRVWWEVELAYNAIRDEFDRRPQVDHEVNAAMARADGYKEALDDCDRADVAKLIGQVAVLEGRLSLQKALTTIAERKFEGQAARIAELEDAARISPSTGDMFNELLRRIDFDGMDPRTFSLAELERAIPGAKWPA